MSLWGPLQAQAPFWGTTAHLQEGLYFAVDAYQGKLLKHRPTKMLFELPEPTRGLSLEVGKQCSGRRYWHALYGYPRLGWRAFVQSFGNAEVLGRAYTIYPFVDLALYRRERFATWFRFGYSFAWVDRIYDPLTNPENTAIGSGLNNLTTLSLLLDYRFAPRWQVRLGGQLAHTSNGRFRQPNLGLNTTLLRVGLAYTPQVLEKRLDFDYAAFPFQRNWKAVVRVGLGGKELKGYRGPLHRVWTVAAGTRWQFTRKNQLHAGLTLTYDEALASFMQDQEIPVGFAGLQPWRPDVYLGHEFLMGRAGILTQTFFYLDHPFQGEAFMGFKIGPNLHFAAPQNMPRFNGFVGIYLKAHKAVADYVELTAGVSF